VQRYTIRHGKGNGYSRAFSFKSDRFSGGSEDLSVRHTGVGTNQSLSELIKIVSIKATAKLRNRPDGPD